MGGDAVFGDLVHLPRSDLDFKGDALLADDGGVEGLVHIRLRGGDIVLEPVGDEVEHIVHQTEDVIAVGDVVHDDAEGVQVEDLIQRLVLGVHLAVDGVDVLDAAVHLAVHALLVHPRLNFRLGVGQKLLMGGKAGFQLVLDVVIAHRVEVFQRQILQLPLDLLHTEPVRQRRVDLHRLQRLFPLLFRRLVLHGAHIVQPVADLDQHHADVLGHGQQHLAQVLHLLFFPSVELHPGQLGHALDKVGHRRAEALGDLLMGRASVLNGVVEHGGDDAVLIQLQIGHDAGHRQRMGDIGTAVLALLGGVGVVGVLERVEQLRLVQIGVICQHLVFQCVVLFKNGIHGHQLRY